jgi:hypothetical protein
VRLVAIAVLAFALGPLAACDDFGVVSSLDVQNRSAETVILLVEPYYYRVPPGSAGYVVSFSGPRPVPVDVPVLHADCTSLAAVTWPRDRNNTIVTIDADLTVGTEAGQVDPSDQSGDTRFRSSFTCPPP